MPVYLFTYHAYRTWNADDPRGFVPWHEEQKPPDAELARSYDRQAKQPPVTFDAAKQEALLWIVHDCCDRRQWRLHYAATDPTHVHVLVSWKEETLWKDVSTRIKNLASRALGQIAKEKGRRWFVRRSSRKQVKEEQHLDYLMTTYLPKHRGKCWREGDPPPKKPAGIED